MVSAGRILTLPKGDWNNTTMYNMLDLVSYNGITWLCKRQCVGITPSVEQVEYWQQFGSAAPIASTSVAGLVMPDGTTITIDPTTGAIAVPIAKTNGVGLVKPDGTTITIDANGTISSTGGNLSNLGDVAITSLQNGQTIVWNAANQKWQNGDVAGTLAALSDVTITGATDGQIFAYSASQGKWINATAESTLSNSTKPIQTKVVKDMASDVIETLSAGASQAYSAGDLIMCSNGKWYKAITDISQNQTLTAGGNVEETSQRALNTNLTQSLNGFEFREDSQSGKGQYSMDGGSTWQNFSSGDVTKITFPGTYYGFGQINGTSEYCIFRDINVYVGDSISVLKCGTRGALSGYRNIYTDDKLKLDMSVNSNDIQITAYVDLYFNQTLVSANTTRTFTAQSGDSITF